MREFTVVARVTLMVEAYTLDEAIVKAVALRDKVVVDYDVVRGVTAPTFDAYIDRVEPYVQQTHEKIQPTG